MGRDVLPTYAALNSEQVHKEIRRHQRGRNVSLRTLSLTLIGAISIIYYLSAFTAFEVTKHHVYEPTNNPVLEQIFAESLAKCDAIDAPVGAPKHFHTRTKSDRYQEGTPDILIRNATVWTGEEEGNQILYSHDILVSKGLIKSIRPTRELGGKEVETIEAEGKWVTPGLVDMHVHISVGALPTLKGDDDVNSIGKNINPYLRSIDGMNQHDVSFKKSIAGGITSGLVLPGSANSIGGQAFPIKYRSVSSHSPSDRLIDPPTSLVQLRKRSQLADIETGMFRNDSSSSWRYMKMACGENARRVYSITRFDEAWDLRRTFSSAKTLKNQQDQFCSSARSFVRLHGTKSTPSASESVFPEDLEQEAIVALLREKVKLNTHCYTQIDFESFVRHSNEFSFPISSFHHAHEAYLVPEVLKQTYGATPAIAMFSTNANYKLESYFGTPFAGAILQSHNITPIYKSDHPVTDSRRILNQAAQAHHFGLAENYALSSVISSPAKNLGLDYRLGFLKPNWDADIVIWNIYPLRMGAMPVEVLSDGIRQLNQSYVPSLSIVNRKDHENRFKAPKSANFTKEIEKVKNSYDQIIGMETVAFPTAKGPTKECVIFYNISERFYKNSTRILSETYKNASGMLVFQNGETICSGTNCDDSCSGNVKPQKINLNRGTVIPGLTSFGSNLGLTDIVSESEASDGYTEDSKTISEVKISNLDRAVDGLQYSGHDLRRARASGVTSAIVFPESDSFYSGISVKFSTGAKTSLDPKAVVKSQVAVHITLTHDHSISEQMGMIRRLLTGDWADVSEGKIPLVITALRADHIATLLKLKDEFPHLKLIISGCTECHLLASELSSRKVPAILIPQTWPRTFDENRAIDGPPLTKNTTLSVLLDSGVKTALKVEEGWMASNLFWDACRAGLEISLSREKIIQLITTAVDDVLGIETEEEGLVFYDGDPFEYGAKIVALHTPSGTEFVTQ